MFIPPVVLVQYGGMSNLALQLFFGVSGAEASILIGFLSVSFFLEFMKDELLVSGDVGSEIGNENFFQF